MWFVEINCTFDCCIVWCLDCWVLWLKWKNWKECNRVNMLMQSCTTLFIASLSGIICKYLCTFEAHGIATCIVKCDCKKVYLCFKPIYKSTQTYIQYSFRSTWKWYIFDFFNVTWHCALDIFRDLQLTRGSVSLALHIWISMRKDLPLGFSPCKGCFLLSLLNVKAVTYFIVCRTPTIY